MGHEGKKKEMEGIKKEKKEPSHVLSFASTFCFIVITIYFCAVVPFSCSSSSNTQTFPTVRPDCKALTASGNCSKEYLEPTCGGRQSYLVDYIVIEKEYETS